jgi:anti-sigma factor RsiW
VVGVRRILVLVVIIAAGCSGGKHSAAPSVPTTVSTAGVATGRMFITGGPPIYGSPAHNSPLPGVVEVRRPFRATVLARVTVGKSGAFRIALPAGKYQLVGHPANAGIGSFSSREFSVIVGRTTAVDLVDLAT